MTIPEKLRSSVYVPKDHKEENMKFAKIFWNTYFGLYLIIFFFFFHFNPVWGPLIINQVNMLAWATFM